MRTRGGAKPAAAPKKAGPKTPKKAVANPSVEEVKVTALDQVLDSKELQDPLKDSDSEAIHQVGSEVRVDNNAKQLDGGKGLTISETDCNSLTDGVKMDSNVLVGVLLAASTGTVAEQKIIGKVGDDKGLIASGTAENLLGDKNGTPPESDVFFMGQMRDRGSLAASCGVAGADEQKDQLKLPGAEDHDTGKNTDGKAQIESKQEPPESSRAAVRDQEAANITSAMHGEETPDLDQKVGIVSTADKEEEQKDVADGRREEVEEFNFEADEDEVEDDVEGEELLELEEEGIEELDMSEDDFDDAEVEEEIDAHEGEPELGYELEENEAKQDGENVGSAVGLETETLQSISEQRKQKRVEVFVGGLDKDTTEDELRTIFKKVGKVIEIRLSRNLKTGKNKGYAFVRYADSREAKRAVDELNLLEVHGRPCRVMPSEENDVLYLGNICKVWTKEKVVETLKKYSIENLEGVTLLEDTQNDGMNRGFAFLEFLTHKDALKAFTQLQKSDAVFGSERSAKVAWAQPLNEPEEEVMSQVKTVFVDGMPPTWDEDQVKEHFGKYGEIKEIVLGRNRSSRRKDFGFVTYATRESAIGCIEATNNSQLFEGERKIKLKVRLSKPVSESTDAKGGIRGGFTQESKLHRTGQPGRSFLQGAKRAHGIGKFVTPRIRDREGAISIHRRREVMNPNIGARYASREVTISDRGGAGRDRLYAREDRSRRGRIGGILHGRGSGDSISMQHLSRADVYDYVPEVYADRFEYEATARGRKRGYTDLEGQMYSDSLEIGRSRARRGEVEAISFAGVGSPYGTLPYREIASRVPVRQVAQYTVGPSLGLSGALAQQRQPYALYDSLSSARGQSAYPSGGYAYGTAYSIEQEQMGRGSSYRPPSYGARSYGPSGNVQYSSSGVDLGPYY
ncbi:hypothetical protein O6H91_18G019100 [Diphasiastrum complanatum]|uniref:Uncharacterized protein n=1 Tax=Diphasiastrum complanatum TaxID=34168 RepID=A0ACC2AYI1_DIPCM|nr:hypothetical protein O6H91_18G019100 [Diphasiastrum complanatum]